MLLEFVYKNLVLLIAILVTITMSAACSAAFPAPSTAATPGTGQQQAVNQDPTPTVLSADETPAQQATPAATESSDGPIVSTGGPGAATGLQAEAFCETVGDSVAELRWELAATPGSAQRVDVTIYSFEGEQFESSELLPPDQTTLKWEDVGGQAIHFWRVLTRHPEGWVSSEIAQFEGVICIGDEVEEPTAVPTDIIP